MKYYILHEETPSPKSRLLPIILAILGAVSIIIGFILGRKLKKEVDAKKKKQKKTAMIVAFIAGAVMLVISIVMMWKAKKESEPTVETVASTVSQDKKTGKLSSILKPVTGLVNAVGGLFKKKPTSAPSVTVVKMPTPGYNPQPKGPGNQIYLPKQPQQKAPNVPKQMLIGGAKLAVAPAVALAGAAKGAASTVGKWLGFEDDDGYYEEYWEIQPPKQSTILVIRTKGEGNGSRTLYELNEDDIQLENGRTVPAWYVHEFEFAAYAAAEDPDMQVEIVRLEEGEEQYILPALAAVAAPIAGFLGTKLGLITAAGGAGLLAGKLLGKKKPKTAGQEVASGAKWGILIAIILAVIIAIGLIWKWMTKEKKPQQQGIQTYSLPNPFAR